MKKALFPALLLTLGIGIEPGFAFVKHGVGAVVAPSNVALPEIVGLDTVGSTLTVRPGVWDGSAGTRTYRWHMIEGSTPGSVGPTLGTGTSFGPLASAMVTACAGSTRSACGRLQVDETVTNSAGSGTVISNFIGPVETALPSPPPVGAGPAPTAWPTYPAHYLQNGHAIYPGHNIPPVAPTTSPTHVWFFDPINGQSITGGATGHAGSPFQDINAIFAVVSGYGAVPLFPTVIQPGDAIYIKPGAGNAVLGSWAFSDYSTSDGTASGTPLWTWIMADPAGSANPVISGMIINASSNFIFKGINVEGNALQTSTFSSGGAAMINVGGNYAAPTFDLIFEDMSMTSRLGYSNDSWEPSAYPTTGGHSDGTIQTASPYIGTIGNTQGVNMVSATLADPRKLFLQQNSIPVFTGANRFIYVWGPGYYPQAKEVPNFPIVAPNNTGIPNGTIITDLNGIANPNLKGNVNGFAGLPATAVVNDAYLDTSTGATKWHLWYGTAGPVWTDMGPAYFGIDHCDPVNDAPTGCPSTLTTNGTPFIGCDPKVTPMGQMGWPSATCPGATPPLWNGVTRNMTNENVDTTPNMIIVPSGWWNHLDWNYTLYGFRFHGESTGTNDSGGLTGVSVKNSMLRYMWSHFSIDRMADIILYNNRMKYRSADAIQILTSLRTISANNFTSDVTFLKEHQDCLQFGQSTIYNTAQFYGNAVVDNECYTYVDPINPFVQFTQSIGNTDQIYTGTYAANNIIFASGAPGALFLGGLYNVYANNDAFQDKNGGGGVLSTDSGAKGGNNLPPISLVGNNLLNSLDRNILTAITGVGAVVNGAALWQPTNAGGLATTCVANSPVGSHTVTSHVANAVSTLPGETFTMQAFVNPSTAFTINGTGFGTSTGTVTIGGIAVTNIISWNATQIVGSIPVGAPNPSMGSVGPPVVPPNFTVSAGTPTTTTSVGYNATYTALAGTTGTTMIGSTATGGAVCPTTPVTAGEGTVETITPSCSVDQNTVTNNLDISVVNIATGIPSTSSATHCAATTNAMTNSTGSGVFPDINIWSPFDWRNSASNPLVLAYNPVPAGPSPGSGQGLMNANSCLQNEVPVGICAPASVGLLNMRPNPAFVPTSTVGLTQVPGATSMPLSGAIGDRFLAGAIAACNPGFPICGAAFGATTFPAGLYTRCADGSTFVAPCLAATPSGTMAAYGAVASPFNPNASPFTPGIIGQGVDLGLQMPPTTHGRLPWTNPPNIGAY